MNAIDRISDSSERYARCIQSSKRVRWDIDKDVVRGRRFDTRKPELEGHLIEAEHRGRWIRDPGWPMPGRDRDLHVSCIRRFVEKSGKRFGSTSTQPRSPT